MTLYTKPIRKRETEGGREGGERETERERGLRGGGGGVDGREQTDMQTGRQRERD